MKKNTKNVRRYKFTQHLKSIFLIGYTTICSLWAQEGNVRIVAGQDVSKRPIITAVPFLGFAPDARSASMGDIGVATRPDLSSIHWNNAKLAFARQKMGASFSYTPWLSNLVDDMYIAYLTGYTKINDIQAIAFSLRYFNLGDIFLTSETGADAGTFSPRDFAVDLTYARKLSERIGLGISMRFLNSTLSQSYEPGNSGKSASGFSADIGFYHTNLDLFSEDLMLSWGAHISNIGTKITYGDAANENFIPTNFRLGTALRYAFDEENSLTAAVDLNKLLVPTPPIYERDETGQLTRNTDGDLVVSKGGDPSSVSSIGALFSSFSDAPNGFSEELQEISAAIGLAYWYKDLFSMQTGYHHESVEKGNRKYFTLGAGFRYNVFGIDFAYLLPSSKNHPLAQTLRFSMYFTFGPSTQSTSNNSLAPSSTETIQNEQY